MVSAYVLHDGTMHQEAHTRKGVFCMNDMLLSRKVAILAYLCTTLLSRLVKNGATEIRFYGV
jgi:hypothetical protein